jgi:hypothetical protein
MKKFIFLFILISIYNICLAQDTTFSKLIESFPGTLMINAIRSHGDNYYCLFLQVDTPNNQYSQYGLLKLNSSFAVVDSSLIDIDKTVILKYGLGFDNSTNDSTFVVAGTIQYYPGYQIIERGYIVKFDKNLDTIWTKEIAHPDTAYADTCQTPWVVLTDVKITPTGDYLISGNYNHQCEGNRDRLFILKMDPNGTILWWKFYPQFIHQDGFIGGIELASEDSGFYFKAIIDPHQRLYKLDKNGNIQWSIPVNLNQSRAKWYGLREYGDNIIVANAYYTGTIFSKLCVTSVNIKTQSINWEKNFPNNWLNSIFLRGETMRIVITQSGNIAIGMSGMQNGNRPEILLLNSSGDVLWNRYYTYGNATPPEAAVMEFNDLVLCDDGGFMLGGTISDPQIDPLFFKAWLIKTDSNGVAPGAILVSVEEQTIVIKREPPVMYPVPATDQLNIRFQETMEDPLFIEVFSLSGQKLLQEQLPPFDTEYRINIHDLPAGTYLIRLSNGQELLYSSKFVKR